MHAMRIKRINMTFISKACKVLWIKPKTGKRLRLFRRNVKRGLDSWTRGLTDSRTQPVSMRVD